jgi:hypothetical protein
MELLSAAGAVLTGATLGGGTPGARNSVFLNQEHPSHVILPIVPPRA